MAAGVELTIVSIGKPEVGAKLMTHLGISDGQEFFFVDPINKVYDDLDLNRGVDVTFFNPAIPMAFGNRLLQGKGIVSKELSEVLLKWKDAFFIPPKAEQAFNQGGAFLFQDNDTIYAHYDEATAAHAVPSEMIDRALGVASSETKSLANALTKPN